MKKQQLTFIVMALALLAIAGGLSACGQRGDLTPKDPAIKDSASF